jgi:hypothetical protein
LLNPYSFGYAGSNKEDGFKRHIYRFKTRFNRTYIVNADEFDNDIFVVKFYMKRHRLSPNKFKILANDHDAKRVLDTCVAIGTHILDSKPKASFGFIGEPGKGESKFRTKRFLVYFLYATKHYSPFTWEHYPDENISAYFLLNSKNESLNMSQVEALFGERYDLV